MITIDEQIARMEKVADQSGLEARRYFSDPAYLESHATNEAILDTLRRVKVLENAITLMAEDGWLYHGVEGMSDAQKICTEAYLLIHPKNP